MNEILARNLLIRPVHALRGERIGKYFKEAKAVESLTKDAVAEFQQRKLLALLKTASRTSPYYSQLFNTLWGRDTIPKDALADFKRIPFLTKEIVRQTQNASSRFSSKCQLDCRSTSGSTGIPLRFFKDRFATGHMEAVQLCAYSWNDIGAGAPQGRFWGMPQGAKGKLLTNTKDFLKNRIRFSAFDLDDGAKTAFYNKLKSFKPTYFYGYPSLICEFGRFLKEKNLDLSTVPLRVIIGTGEFVYADEKQEIEKTFQVPFVNEYGCTETGVIAFDCSQGRMHVMVPNIYLEVLKDDVPVIDEEGEICVTELNSVHFPFIRYKIGDRGKLVSDPCPCGLHWPVLEILAGRRDDYVITPGGDKIYDAIFAYTLKDGIVNFKAVQESKSLIVVYLITDSTFNNEMHNKYINQLKNVIGDSIEVRFELTDVINRTNAGKFRYFERRF